MTKDELVLEWSKSRIALMSAKDKEMFLRNEVIKECFRNHKEEGTENVDLGAGYKLKAVFKQSYTFPDKLKVDEALSKIEALGAEGEYIAERLVKYKPELSISEYKKLDKQYRDIIDTVIVTKPAYPSLELIEPKVKI
jgi:hypothetical protein